MKAIIQAKNIDKKYGSLAVLDQVSLSIHSKEIVAIVGPSGAGKTTLLHILGTLDSPTNPETAALKIAGTDMMQLSDKALAKFRNQHLGFIFQFHELLPEFTALENVCLPAWIGNKNPKETRHRAKALLELLGLKNRANHKPTALSGGEQQRVAVARALINNPKVVFADEPTGNLDSDNAQRLHDLLFTLRDQTGCSFVIVTHNKDLANKADRTLRIKDGRIQT